MKKLMFIALMIICTAQASSAPKINKNEYKQLIAQCQAIRARILQENNFEVIREQTRQTCKEMNARIAERFGNHNSKQFQANSNIESPDLTIRLNAQKVQYQLQVNALIVKTITAYLTTLNTRESTCLLAELIANGFNF